MFGDFAYVAYSIALVLLSFGRARESCLYIFLLPRCHLRSEEDWGEKISLSTGSSRRSKKNYNTITSGADDYHTITIYTRYYRPETICGKCYHFAIRHSPLNLEFNRTVMRTRRNTDIIWTPGTTLCRPRPATTILENQKTL